MKKIRSTKYQSFILSFYIVSIFMYLFLSFFHLRIPIIFFQIVCIIPFLFKINILRKEKIMIYLFFLINLFIILCSKDISRETSLSYQKLFIYVLIAVLYSGLNISLKILKKYLSFFCFASFIVLIFYLFFKENISIYYINYMGIGYQALILTLCFIYLFKETLKLRYLFFSVFSLIIILFFGNKFALIIGVFGLLFFLFFSKIKFIKIFLFTILVFFIIIFHRLETIFKMLIDVLQEYNISIFSLTRFYDYLISIKQDNGIFDSRGLYYFETVKLIKKFPFLGSGILGYINNIPLELYNSNGIFYPHNIFLEILSHFGIIGFFFFFIIVFFIIKKIYKMKKMGYTIDFIYFIFVFLTLELLASNSYLFQRWFWLSILIPYNKSYYKPR